MPETPKNEKPTLSKRDNLLMALKYLMCTAGAGIIQFVSFTLLNTAVHFDRLPVFLKLFPGAAVTELKYGPSYFVALALSTEVWLAPHTGALKWPVRGYALIICVMAAMATLRPTPLLVSVAALFVASDLLLAVQMFRARGTLARVLPWLVWPCYWLGQALILSAFLPAAP